MAWFNSTDVTVANGSTTVTVNDGADTSLLRAGDALVIGQYAPVEIDSLTADVINLRYQWGESNQTNQAAVGVPTTQDAKKAADGLNNAILITAQNYQSIQDWGTQLGTVTFYGYDGTEYTARTLRQMDADAQSAIDNIDVVVDKYNVSLIGNGIIAKPDFDADFTFSASVANTFTINAMSYYVNGKVIEMAQTNVVLPAAPDSSLLPVRYDLVYLRDDGQYLVLEGFVNETDPTLADLGYTYQDDDLWFDGDNYAVEVIVQARLNQGAYSKEYNESGAATKGGKYLTGYRPTSLADCFDGQSGGSIAAGASSSGRPDGQFYDAIYAAYAKDVRSSSVVRPLAEIREDYLRKSIAGEVRGWEKVPFTEVELSVEQLGSSPSLISIPDTTGWSVGDLISVVNAGSIDVSNAKVIAINTNSWVKINGTWPRVLGISVDVIHTSWLNQRAAEHTWTDLVGDPQRLLATFPEGVQGQWIPIIPDGAGSLVIPLSRKALSFFSETPVTTDDGASWAEDIVTLDSVTNSITDSSINTVGLVGLINYTTHAHFTEDADNAEVLSIGEALATNSNQIGQGGLLTSSLIGKVGTGNDGAQIQQGYDVYGYRLDGGELSDSAHSSPSHLEFSLTDDNNSPAIKTLDYLTVESGKLNLQLAYKEMAYDGTWGDDNQFQITNGQSTMIDTNGNTVLYGTAKLQDHCVQYFYPEWEQS